MQQRVAIGRRSQVWAIAYRSTDRPYESSRKPIFSIVLVRVATVIPDVTPMQRVVLCRHLAILRSICGEKPKGPRISAIIPVTSVQFRELSMGNDISVAIPEEFYALLVSPFVPLECTLTQILDIFQIVLRISLSSVKKIIDTSWSFKRHRCFGRVKLQGGNTFLFETKNVNSSRH